MRVSICKAAGGGDGLPAAVEQGNVRFGAAPRDLTAAIWFEVGRRQALELHFDDFLRLVAGAEEVAIACSLSVVADSLAGRCAVTATARIGGEGGWVPTAIYCRRSTKESGLMRCSWIGEGARVTGVLMLSEMHRLMKIRICLSRSKRNTGGVDHNEARTEAKGKDNPYLPDLLLLIPLSQLVTGRKKEKLLRVKEEQLFENNE
ncbi:unnamed protein product [Cuscuta campestris]|uniref:Uncharacterized protein n=1 Tax=Cuscuta campestris TaxID=132261 RepID=A0A484KEI6_9ASTE|nr:unnamed protein product [Cuscuta campestris]